jgi:ABC-type sulfate transport system permease subunit
MPMRQEQREGRHAKRNGNKTGQKHVVLFRVIHQIPSKLKRMHILHVMCHEGIMLAAIAVGVFDVVRALIPHVRHGGYSLSNACDRLGHGRLHRRGCP